MSDDFSHQLKIMNDYIHGLEQEIRLKTEIIETQKELIERMRKYEKDIEAIIEDFPSLVEGV